MDPSSTSESSIPPHDTVPGPSQYTGQNDLASQSLAGFFGSFKESDVNEGLSSGSHEPHPYTYPHAMAESAHLLFSGSVPNIPHRQGQSYPQPASLPGEGPPSQTDFHITPASAQWDGISWRYANQQMEMVTQDQFKPPQRTYGVPGPSAPTELPPTKIPGVLPSRHNEPDVDPGTEGAHVRGVSPEASARPSKKRKDMLRKRDQRAEDRQNFAGICELLEIPLTPKRTLSHRILVGIEELVKQRKLDDALRRRLVAGEIDLAVVRGELVQEHPDIEAIPSHGLGRYAV